MSDERDRGDFDDDEEPTAVERPGRKRPASVEAIALANVAVSLNRLSHECAPLAAAFDELEADERRTASRAFARKYRELGDICHDIARTLEEIAAIQGR